MKIKTTYHCCKESDSFEHRQPTNHRGWELGKRGKTDHRGVIPRAFIYWWSNSDLCQLGDRCLWATQIGLPCSMPSTI